MIFLIPQAGDRGTKKKKRRNRQGKPNVSFWSLVQTYRFLREMKTNRFWDTRNLCPHFLSHFCFKTVLPSFSDLSVLFVPKTHRFPFQPSVPFSARFLFNFSFTDFSLSLSLFYSRFPNWLIVCCIRVILSRLSNQAGQLPYSWTVIYTAHTSSYVTTFSDIKG